MEIKPKCIQDLYDILKDEQLGLVGKWRAGELLDTFFRSMPAKPGDLEELSDALPKDIPASRETLHNCRKLYREWDLSEVRSAQLKGQSWRRIVQLLSIKSILASFSKSKREKFQSELSVLVVDKSSDKEWTQKYRAFKQRLGGKGQTTPPKKKISEQGRVAVDRLGDAAVAWADIRDAIPETFRDQHEALSLELTRLKADIEKLNVEMLSPDKLAPYEES